MRYGPDHKAQTRSRILDAASRLFRRDGIEAVGVAAVMSAADLTHGGFYAHFASKEALVAEAVRAAFAETTARLAATAQRAPEGEGLAALLAEYLSIAHRDAPDRGCTAAALAGEIPRASAEVRAAFEAGFAGLVALVAGLLEAAPEDAEGNRRALLIVSTMVGALTLARAVPDAAGSAAILDAARHQALSMAAG